MKKPIYVVLGLPRSGTSLMMQMLGAGGVSIHADSPVSCESKDIFRLPKDSAWLKKCHGKALKVLEPLTYTLPRDYEYRFILMRRDYVQQAKSFKKLMDSVGVRTDYHQYLEALQQSFAREIPLIQNKYTMYPGRLKVVDFERLIEQPREVAQELQEHLRMDLDIEQMVGVVQPRPSACLDYMLEAELIRRDRLADLVASGGVA